MSFDRSAAAFRTQSRRTGNKMDSPTQQFDALSHGPEAVRLAGYVQFASNVESSTIILDFHGYGVGPAGQGDLDIVRIRVSDYVGQRSLQDLVQCRLAAQAG